MLKDRLTDEKLWEGVVEDDSRAFAVLYNRYWKKLYKTVDHYLKDSGIAEQVVHDVFVVLWRRRKHLNIKSFADYIHVTARYHVFKELKARKVSPIEYVESYEGLDAGKVSNAIEEKLNYKDFERKLTDSLKPLPKRCREIFWLSRMENLTNDEIAEKLNISKRTVENQITIALRHLRNFIQEDTASVFSLLLFTLWR